MSSSLAALVGQLDVLSALGAGPSTSLDEVCRLAYRLAYASHASIEVPVALTYHPPAPALGSTNFHEAAMVVLRQVSHQLGPLFSDLPALHQELLTADLAWDGSTWASGPVEPTSRAAGATPTGRAAAGAWFTPAGLVEHVLDLAQVGPHDSVLDPACGAGEFLVAVAARCRHAGLSPGDIAGLLHGVDIDGAAVELARVRLWVVLGLPARLDLVQSDSLVKPLRAPDGSRLTVDVVVGNPPFLSQLARGTTRSRERSVAIQAQLNFDVGAYTDLSAIFLGKAFEWVAHGGTVAFVQPQSLLAARDAQAVRDHVGARGQLTAFWSSTTPMFNAAVATCAVVVAADLAGPASAIRRTHGPDFADLDVLDAARVMGSGRTWAPLLTASLGIPEVNLGPDRGTLADLAEITADFRDQYYGLQAHVYEEPDCEGGVRLITTGLIGQSVSRWGLRGCTFGKRSWRRPVVDVEGLPASLQAWAASRLQPKVLLATQGRVVEAVVDEHGAWLPSVPVVSLVTEHYWHLAAILNSPGVLAWAAARVAGTAMSPQAVKLSARLARDIPLPVDQAAWDRAAQLVERAHKVASTSSLPSRPGALEAPSETRGALLYAAAEEMCAAYEHDSEPALSWWWERSGLSHAS